MKKRVPDKFWFPWWPDKWIFGSVRIECTPAERGIWVDLLSLASKDDGHIRANEDTPYPLEQLSGMLIIPIEDLTAAITKFLTTEKLTQLKSGTLYITKWDKYQFTDRHKRRIESEMSGKSDTIAEHEDAILNKSKKEKRIKNNKKEEVIIPNWIPKEEFEEYKKMRQKIKKPMTDRAIELAIKKLETLKSEGYDPQQVLEQSILNSWQGLFPLKDDRKEYQPSQVGRSTKKTTLEQDEYYKARQEKEKEIRAKYKKEMSEIRKAKDKKAWDILQDKMAEEAREWSINYRESKGGQE